MKQIKDHRGGNNSKVAHAQSGSRCTRRRGGEFGIYLFFSNFRFLIQFCVFVTINNPSHTPGGAEGAGGRRKGAGDAGGCGGAKSIKPECPLVFNKNKYLPLKI